MAASFNRVFANLQTGDFRTIFVPAKMLQPRRDVWLPGALAMTTNDCLFVWRIE